MIPVRSFVAVLLLESLFGYALAEIKFTLEPKSEAVKYGMDVLLDCEASDSSDSKKSLRYQWYFNSVPNPNGASVFTNHSLLIADIKNEQLGNYTCGVSEVPKDDNDVAKTIMSPVATVIHAYIHGFASNPSDLTSEEGKKVTLTCVTGESAPVPTVVWEKDGKVVTGGSQYITTYGSSAVPGLAVQYSMTLVLNAKPTDSGMYNCMAKNTLLGVEVRSLKVVVTIKPIDKAPYLDPALYRSKVLSPIDKPLIIDCPVLGYPVPKYHWNFNGQNVTSTDRVEILSNGSLMITRLLSRDNGPYRCTGTNKLGTISAPVITVGATYISTKFQREPYTKFVIAGTPLTIPCHPPDSYPPATVKWFHNNKAVTYRVGSLFIVDPQNAVWDLFISSIQKPDEGEYFCVAVNNNSLPTTRTSKTGTISVGGAPIFIQPPQSVAVKRGEGVKLTCLVGGDPFPAIQWLQDGIDLVPNSQITFLKSNQEIHIRDTNKANEGTYSCQARNSYGTARHDATVTVLVPAVIIEASDNKSVSIGTNVRFICRVEGDPTPDVVWYKDDRTLTIGDRILKTREGLVVNNISLSDAGLYMCHASNSAGNVSARMSLYVTALPFFLKRPKDQLLVITHAFNLSCDADGNPKPVLNWLFNGTNLFPTGIVVSLDRKLLQVSSVSWQHVGSYTCIASSQQGTVTWTATVKLQVPASVHTIAGNSVVYKAKPLELICLVNGVPYPSINWKHNGHQMSPSVDGRITIPQKHRLYIKHTLPADAGEYKCEADNTVGKSEFSTQVFIIEAPLPPVLLDPESRTSNSVKIVWRPATQLPHTPVAEYHLYYKEKLALMYKKYSNSVAGTVVSMVLEGLTPGVEYYFLVTATNEAGEGNRSNVKAVKTLDANPSKPRSLQIVSEGSTEVKLQWEIPAVTNGVVKKYKVFYKTPTQAVVSKEIVSTAVSPVYTVKNLQPYTEYEFWVQAATVENDVSLWGESSSPVQAKTSAAAPSGSPTNVMALPLSAYEIQVKWDDVAVTQRQGPTQKFHILYRPLTSGSTNKEMTVSSAARTLNLTGLLPWTYFSVAVVAENAAGRGPSSSEIVVRTHPAAPSSPPINFRVEPVSMDTINLQFQLPDKSTWNSDLTGYKVEYKSQTSTVSTLTVNNVNSLSLNISNLDPWTEYMARLALFSGLITPLQGPFTEWTKAKTLGTVSGPVVGLSVMSTPTSLSLTWKSPAKANGIVNLYLVEYYVISLVNQNTATLSNSNNNGGEILISNQNVVKREIHRNLLTSESGVDIVKRETTPSGNKLPGWVAETDKELLISTCELFANNMRLLQLFDTLLTNYTETVKSEGRTEDPSVSINHVLTIWSQTASNETELISNLTSTLQNISKNLQDWILTSKVLVTDVCTQLRNDITESGFQIMTINSTEESAILKDLNPGTHYSITIYAFNEFGKGDNLTFITSTDNLPPPPPPPPTTSDADTTTTVTMTTTVTACTKCIDGIRLEFRRIPSKFVQF